jgi:hypothetical protein
MMSITHAVPNGKAAATVLFTEGSGLMVKHSKRHNPTDADLRDNPLIGGSKGVNMARATPDDVEDAEGANTIEGDLENDPNRQGGIDKTAGRGRRGAPHGQ